jgi:predicted kinase
MKVDPADDQGRVVAEAKERAVARLRRKESFVWNATNTTRHMRQSLAALFSAYHAAIDIVYIETDYRTLLQRNAGGRVPRQVIERLIDRLDPPDLTEGYDVQRHLVLSSDTLGEFKPSLDKLHPT